MIVTIDAGNSRIKWGVHDGAAWIAQGALPTEEAARLAEVAPGWPAGADVVACSVWQMSSSSAPDGSAMVDRWSSTNWARSACLRSFPSIAAHSAHSRDSLSCRVAVCFRQP